jgi:hypothetical protein
VCPFLDRSDARCDSHLTLANIARAFAHCADQYSVCPIYRAMMAEPISSDDGRYESLGARGLLVAS